MPGGVTQTRESALESDAAGASDTAAKASTTARSERRKTSSPSTQAVDAEEESSILPRSE